MFKCSPEHNHKDAHPATTMDDTNNLATTTQRIRMDTIAQHLFPLKKTNNNSIDNGCSRHHHQQQFKTNNNSTSTTTGTIISSKTDSLKLILKYLLSSNLLFKGLAKYDNFNSSNSNNLSENNNNHHQEENIDWLSLFPTSSQFIEHSQTAGKQVDTISEKKGKSKSDPTSHPGLINKIIRSFQGNSPLSTDSLQAFNNILFLVNSIPPSVNSVSIFDIMLRTSKLDSDLLPFLAQVKIPKSALGGTDYKTFIATLSKVQMYLPSWYYNSLVLAKALSNFDSILLYCAQRFAREIKVQKAITGALIYPAIMTVIGLLGITMLLTKILPQNIGIFESMGLTVPSFLQFTNYLVRSIQYHWLALIYIIPSTMSSEYLPFKSFLKWQYIRMHTPIGNLTFLQDKATLLHTLSLLDKEQITSKLLIVCSNISSNPILQHMVESMASLAKYGAGADEVLAYMLKQKHIFSPYEIAYLQACFMSGKHVIIQDGLKYVSQMVLKEYTQRLQTLLKILNPATVAIIGVLVIVIAVLGIYPMIALTGAVTAK